MTVMGLAEPAPMTTASTAWMTQAACRAQNLNLFFPDPYEPAGQAARRTCASCPVRGDCLAWARAHDEQGIWGGTTDFDREKLRRPRQRAACPSCASRLLHTWPRHQTCLACGLSWLAVQTRANGDAA